MVFGDDHAEVTDDSEGNVVRSRLSWDYYYYFLVVKEVRQGASALRLKCMRGTNRWFVQHIPMIHWKRAQVHR